MKEKYRNQIAVLMTTTETSSQHRKAMDKLKTEKDLDQDSSHTEDKKMW